MTPRRSHLSESEFIDLLDDVLPPVRRAHLGACDACATHAAALAASVVEAQPLDVPEPPPFFWPQFSAKVSEAVANDAARRGLLRWRGPFALRMALATAAAILVAFMLLPQMQSDLAVPAPAAIAVAEPSPAAFVADQPGDLDADEAWAIVRTLAAGMDDDEMREGVSAGVGSVEHLTFQLNDAERVELARLLQEQLRLPSRPESAS